MWNGTAEILKQKPIARRPSASSAIVDGAPPPCGERAADLFEPRRARQRERERDPVEEERARERAEQEVLERGFGADGARRAGSR